MAVHELIHSVADGTGRSDAEIKALLGAAVVTTALITALRAIDTLSQARPFRTPKARLPRLILAVRFLTEASVTAAGASQDVHRPRDDERGQGQRDQ